ncbi:MAG: TniB family NTP-binding protein [Fimbriimonadaceae bacterium]|nr:TniB family NTP-binding protein [Fimbriimonadaceae bacterium]
MGVKELQNISLGRKEDWAKVVHAEPRIQPDRLTIKQLEALAPAAKRDYDKRRRDWHANMGVLRTPQLRAIHENLSDIMDSNVQDGDRTKGAVAIEGAAGLGKSTAVEQFAKEYHLRELTDKGPMTDEGHERWPVCRVTLSGHPTMRDLNLSLLHYFAHPGIRRGNAAEFARRALDTFLACEVRLLIVDDIHFLQWRASDGIKVSNHLKFIANEFPVTLVLVGVGLSQSGLFNHGAAGRDSILAQTARRTTRFAIERFELKDPAGQKQWKSVLRAVDQRLVLAKHHPGPLPDYLGDYLYERSSGHMGSLITLINRASSRAIRTGVEALTKDLLEQTRIDEAAETSRPIEAARLRADHGATKKQDDSPPF